MVKDSSNVNHLTLLFDKRLLYHKQIRNMRYLCNRKTPYNKITLLE